MTNYTQINVSSLSETPPKWIPPSWALTTTALSAIFISIIGFLGNLLTILALPHTRKLRTAATWFVVNLAVIEMFFCLTVLPMSSAHLFNLHKTGEKLFNASGCRLFVFMRYVAIQAELLSIAAIALNRCVLIAIPKKYPNIFTTKRTVGFIFGIWTLSVILMLFPLTEVYGAFSYNQFTQECDFDATSNGPRKLFLSLGFFIPCLIIIISYLYIFYKAKKSSKRVRETCAHSAGMQSDSSAPRPVAGLRNRELRIARTICVIFVVFIVCCTPVTVAHYLGSQGQIPITLLLLHPLYWLQYCLNIFIYVFMNKQYRDAYINYISYFWPRFKAITQTCYQSTDEETSLSQPGGSRQAVGINTPKGIFSKKISVSSQSSNRVATPTPQKRFQCCNPQNSKHYQKYTVNNDVCNQAPNSNMNEVKKEFQKISGSDEDAKCLGK